MEEWGESAASRREGLLVTKEKHGVGWEHRLELLSWAGEFGSNPHSSSWSLRVEVHPAEQLCRGDVILAGVSATIKFL